MILCLDPGFSNFGCSVINQHGRVVDLGTIQTQKTKNKLLRVADDDVQRITHIASKLTELVNKYNIQGVLAELPPSNSQSAAGAKGLGMAVALTTTLFTALNIPVEWATPTEVKRAMTGKENASKTEMMMTACKKHGWTTSQKRVLSKKTGKLLRTDMVYYPIGKEMGKNQFEHIADSLGAYEALKYSNTARMLTERRVA